MRIQLPSDNGNPEAEIIVSCVAIFALHRKAETLTDMLMSHGCFRTIFIFFYFGVKQESICCVCIHLDVLSFVLDEGISRLYPVDYWQESNHS